MRARELPIVLVFFVCLAGVAGAAAYDSLPAALLGASWANDSFDRCMNITLVNATTNPLYNFTTYVNVTRDADMQANYADLRFYNVSCGTTPAGLLDYEMENYTSAHAHFWVRIPQLGSGNTTISVYYKNNSAVSDAQNPRGAWDRFTVSVWHMNDTRGKDSTARNNATVVAPKVSNMSFAVDGGNGFNTASLTHYNVTSSTTLNLVSVGTFTIEFWMRKNNTFPTTFNRIIYRNETGANAYQIAVGAESGKPNVIQFGIKNGTKTYTRIQAASISANTNYHVVATYNISAGKANMTIYINGSNSTNLTSAVSAPGWVTNGNRNLFIGKRPDNSANTFYSGLLDEVRISNTTRSPAWINQSYQAMFNNSRWVKFGAVQSRPTVTPLLSWNQSSIGIGTVTQGASAAKNATLAATGNHVGVTITPVSGNGTAFINASPLSLGNLNDTNTSQVKFNCSPGGSQAAGYYEAVFNVNSTQNASGSNITVNCTVTAQAVCPIVTSAGTTTMTNNYTGAPNSASPLTNTTCVKIAASNVIFDCNGYTITNNGTGGTTYGILLNGSLTNVTVKNCPGISNYTYGIYVSQSNDSVLINNSVYYPSTAFYLENSSGFNITNNTVYKSSNQGFNLHNGSDNVLSGNSVNLSTAYGAFVLTFQADPILTDNFAYGLASAGFIITSTTNANLIGNGIYNTPDFGFVIQGCSNNTILTNNTASNNSKQGFSLVTCSLNTTFIRNIAHNNTRNGFLASSDATFINNTAYNNLMSGFNTYHDTMFINNTAHNNSMNGFQFATTGTNVTAINNTAHSNSQNGFYVNNNSGDTLTANLAYNNLLSGFNITLSNCALSGNTAHANSYGISSNGSSITQAGGHYYGNSVFLLVKNSSLIDFSTVIFDNPAGNFSQMTNISINDEVEPGTSYMINWSANTSALPANYASFAGKFISVTNLTPDVSIDSLVWTWTDAEVSAGGYDESLFSLWAYNDSGWTQLNSSPDTIVNTLSLSALTASGIIGILQPPPNCPVIISAGTYDMSNNYTGAPNNASPVTGTTCVKIAASDVVFDCNGFSITNNGTVGDTSSILLNGSLTNVTVKNCQGISGYAYGIYVYQSNNSLFFNNTAYNHSTASFYLNGSSNNSLTNLSAYASAYGIYLDVSYSNALTSNTVYDVTAHGFKLSKGSGNLLTGNIVSDCIISAVSITLENNTVLTNNTAYNNSGAGFVLTDTLGNTLTGNSAYGTLGQGFVIQGYSNNTVLTNNTAYNNSRIGFSVVGDSMNNTFINNTAYNNSRNGFSIGFGNIFHNNRAYNNLWSGFFGISNNALTNNAAYDNAQHGFQLMVSGTNNTLTNNSAYNNTLNGFYLASSGNTLANNSAYNNTQYGFLISNSNNNSLSNNTAFRNLLAGTYIVNSNSTTLANAHYYNNGVDFKINATTVALPVNFSTVIFDNPTGNFSQFINLSMNDSVEAGISYFINWSANTSALPANYASFAGKFISVTNLTPDVSIDSMAWTWTDAEASAGGYIESLLSLWIYNDSGWTQLNSSPDTVANALSLSALTTSGIIGILRPLPPTAPTVYSPDNATWTGIVPINYTEAVSPNGYPIAYYNISLVYTNETFIQTIQSNNSLSLSYLWDSTQTAAGAYLIRVEACDNLSQCSFGYSEIFTLVHFNLAWNQSLLDIGSVQQGASAAKNATVAATGDHTGVTVTAVSGNGTAFINATPLGLGDMSDSQIQEVKFNCSASASQAPGYYAAVFNVNSYNDTSGSDIIVSCTVTLNTTFDNQSPIITNVNTYSITNQSAFISWTTDEQANGTVNYGTTMALGTTVSNTTSGFYRSISLAGLSNLTVYYYNVTSCDESGNCATNGTFNFTTLQTSGTPPSQWYNASFTKCKNITVSNSGTTTLTDFPVYVNLSYDTDMQADYDDIRFVNNSCNNNATALAYEIENYTTSKADVWVKIPSIPAGGAKISVYYGNSTATSGQNPSGVWNSNYAGVWHLKSNGSALSALDSTSNGKNGMVVNAVAGTGKIGVCGVFDGSGDYINMSSQLIPTNGSFTLEAWTKFDALSVYQGVFQAYRTSASAGRTFFGPAPTTGYLRLRIGGTALDATTGGVSAGTWYHITATRNSSNNVAIYVNGKSVATGTNTVSTDATSTLIGSRGLDTTQDVDGSIDEIRISNVARSANWINQTYGMVANQNTFVTFDSEESRS